MRDHLLPDNASVTAYYGTYNGIVVYLTHITGGPAYNTSPAIVLETVLGQQYEYSYSNNYGSLRVHSFENGQFLELTLEELHEQGKLTKDEVWSILFCAYGERLNVDWHGQIWV